MNKEEFAGLVFSAASKAEEISQYVPREDIVIIVTENVLREFPDFGENKFMGYRIGVIDSGAGPALFPAIMGMVYDDRMQIGDAIVAGDSHQLFKLAHVRPVHFVEFKDTGLTVRFPDEMPDSEGVKLIDEMLSSFAVKETQ